MFRGTAALIAALVAGAGAAPGFAAAPKLLSPGPADADDLAVGNSSPSISADGSLVAFDSDLPLVADDEFSGQNIFLRDVDAGTTELVDVSNSGAEADLPSFDPSLSGNGRFVAFASGATNLVKKDTEGTDDIFVRDLAREKIERISVPRGPADSPSISDDGRYVAFEATLRKPRRIQVFVHDRKTGKTKLLSATPSGAPGRRSSYDPHISGNGRVVAFGSHEDLTGGNQRGTRIMYVADVRRGTLTRLKDAGVVAGVSRTGDAVLYTSRGQDENGLFLVDPKSGTPKRVDRNPDGTVPGATPVGALSADGRTVAYESLNGEAYHVFVRHLGSEKAVQVDVNAAGEEADDGAGAFADSRDPRFLNLSADGSALAFVSRASNLTTPAPPLSQPNIYWSGPL
jgi:Tol biopolymer transport system component